MENFDWLNKKSRIFLSNGYLSEGEDPVDRVKEMGKRAEEILKIDGYCERFVEYASKGWLLFSSPVWANFGKPRGLPISCFGSFIPDSISGIMESASEIAMMTKLGGGTSGYFGEIRHRGAHIKGGFKSDGSVHFMRIFDTVVDTCKQAGVRRGVMGCYLPMEHPDIKEFLKVKHEGHPIQHLFTGVSVGNDWMQDMIDGNPEKRALWALVIKARSEVGMPYIFFRDNVNDAKPQVYHDKGYEIHASNVCSEIMLPSSEDESFVCCLSSLNLLCYDEWKDTDIVETMALFLDAVLTEFIEKAEPIPEMKRAVKFSKNHRAIGIGTCGWHSLLQSKMIPFEGLEAQMLNVEIFKNISVAAKRASKCAATLFGEPTLLKGYGERWTTTMAIAPNTSSAFILGQVSQSIEPYKSNYYVKDLAKFKATVKNPYLEQLLEEKFKAGGEFLKPTGRVHQSPDGGPYSVAETKKQRIESIDDAWQSILQRNGSVQHLSFLTQHEKDVFRTFPEISQKEIVIQAAQRQAFIDQGQSLNLVVSPTTTAKEMNELLIFAWQSGIKSLYYQHSSNAAQTFFRKLNECSACEG